MSAIFARPCQTTGASAARVYRRRRPERTALYRLVQQHLEIWLARSRNADPDGASIPRHVERELRGYLECGILVCGFARAPPELEAEPVGSLGFAFDQSPPWDPTTPPTEPGLSFDQTLA